MSRSINFNGDYPWGNQPGNKPANRPYCEVIIYGPNGLSKYSQFCIVDSGADYLQVPEAALATVGINWVPAWGHEQVMDASFCNFAFRVYRNVEIGIEGKRFALPKLISSPNVPPLLGRSAFLAAMDVGFDSSGWLFRS